MLFSILAFLTLVISVCIKKRNKSLFVQSLSCLFESIYDFIISAYTGAVLNLINFIRTFIFINKNRINKGIYFFCFNFLWRNNYSQLYIYMEWLNIITTNNWLNNKDVLLMASKYEFS